MRVNRILENATRGMLVLGLIAFLLSFGLASPPVSRAQAVLINEIRISQPATDNDEYFELEGAPSTDLTGLTYLVLGDGPGGSGIIEEITDLTGQTIPASGFFVAAEDTFTLGTPDLELPGGSPGDINFEDGDNVTHLLVRDFTGSLDQDLDTDDDGVLDVEPWSSVEDCVALLDDLQPPAGGSEYVYCTAQIGPDEFWPPSQVYRCPSPTWVMGDEALGAYDTPGAANACTTAVTASSLGATAGGLPAVALPMGLGLVAMLVGGVFVVRRRRQI